MASILDNDSVAPAPEAPPAVVWRRPAPSDVLALAVETVLDGRRLDISELAQRVGVSRNTIYRWWGDREDLLTEALWSHTVPLLAALEKSTAHLRGRERIRSVIETHLRYAAENQALRTLFVNERHVALRVLTSSGDGSTYQDRLDAELARLIEEEDARTDLRLGAPAALVAHAVGRALMGYIYNDAIAAVEPQIDKALEVLDFLLAERASSPGEQVAR